MDKACRAGRSEASLQRDRVLKVGASHTLCRGTYFINIESQNPLEKIKTTDC